MALIGNISGSANSFSHIGITGSVIIANAVGGQFPQLPGSDVVFFVSGSITGSGANDKKSSFGGDLVVSGTVYGLNGVRISGDTTKISGDTLELSGTLLVSGTSVFNGNLIVSGAITAVSGFSGSLTTLRDGTSYLIAGNNVSIVSGTNGSVTISNTMVLAPDYFASTTTGAIFTTGSAAFRGNESAVDAPSDKGSDIFFYVSGSASKTGAVASGLGTGVSLFGGDVVVSGSVIVSGAMLQGELYDWASITPYGYYPGTGSFTHGNGTIATGDYSHAEGGNLAWSSGSYSHAEGEGALSEGDYSHAEGNSTWAAGLHSHAEGKITTAAGEAAHAEGSGTHAMGNYSHAEGVGSWAYGLYSHAEGASYAVGTGSHSEGYNTFASGNYAYARGSNTYAIGNYSHAGGVSTKAIGDYSHAEGLGTFASGAYSHSEGQSTITSGSTSHAEGYLTVAIGQYSHAEGTQATAPGLSSHAEGCLTVASGSYSHAEGYYTIASGSYQTVVGKANKRNNASSLFVVGNGSNDADVNRSDVLRVEQNSLQVTGSILGSGIISAATGFSGSLTRLNDDTSYLIAGNNVSIVSGTNGSVTISNTMALAPDYFASTTAGAVFTTGSAAFRGGESAVDAPSDKGSDIFFYVSGSASRTAAAASGLGTGVSLLGGDVVVSGSVIVSGAMLQGELYDWASIVQYDIYPATGSFAHGYASTAVGNYSHAEGRSAYTGGSFSHAEGDGTWSEGESSHAEGNGAYTEGSGSHAEGRNTSTYGNYSHAEGQTTTAYKAGSHAEGIQTAASGNYSHAEGYLSKTIGLYSHAEGHTTIASGTASHAEGGSTVTSGSYSHAEGSLTTASGYASHAEGGTGFAIGDYSHSEGTQCQAIGYASHAAGGITVASGTFSHTEGYQTEAVGAYSHAEGLGNKAYGFASHAEGWVTIASGSYSHAEGYYTITSGSYQSVIGKANKRGNTSSLFVIGNGSADADAYRSDVLRVEQSSLQVTGSILGSGIISAVTGFSGSLTRLNNGTSYIIAGSNITVTSASSGAITIASPPALASWTSAGTINSVGWSATTTSPTVGTTTRNNMSYRQLGSTEWEVVMSFDTTGVSASDGSGDYLFTLPNSLSFDTTKQWQTVYTSSIATNTDLLNKYTIPSSYGKISDGTSSTATSQIIVYDATRFRILLSTSQNRCWGSGNFPLTGVLGGSLTFTFTST